MTPMRSNLLFEGVESVVENIKMLLELLLGFRHMCTVDSSIHARVNNFDEIPNLLVVPKSKRKLE